MAHVDAQLALHGEVGVEPGPVAVVDDDDHAGASEYGRAPDHVVELLEDAQALLGHRRGEAVGIVLPDDGTRLATGAGAEERLLQQDDPPDPARGQGMGNAGADHAAADNQDVRRLRDARNLSYRPILITSRLSTRHSGRRRVS